MPPLARRLAIPTLALALAACKDSAEGAGSGEAPDEKAEAEGKDGADATAQAAGASSSKCKLDAVEKLSNGLAEAPPGTRAMLVAGDLRNACEQPPAFDAFFALTLSPKPPKGESRQEMLQTSMATLDAVCPGGEETRKLIEAVPSDQRMKVLYERCDLQRFDVVSEDDYLRRRPSNPVPWFAYHWLREQKVPEGQAKAIALAMIQGDHPRWAKEGQTLAQLQHPLPPIPEGETVHLTRRMLITRDEDLVAVDASGELDSAAKPGGHLIGPLYDRLAERADEAKEEADFNGKTWKGRLVLVADQTARFSTLVEVLYTAGRAEFTTFAFVAETGVGEYGAIVSEPPKLTATPTGVRTSTAGALAVQVMEDGFIVSIDGQRLDVAPGKTVHPLRPAIALASPGAPLDDYNRYDYAALAASVEKARAKEPKLDTLVVSAEDSIPFGALMRTMETVRGEGCGAGGECLLPKVILSAEMPSAIPVMARHFDPALAAENAGLLGELAAESGTFLKSPYGAAFEVPEGDEDVWGGLTGSEVGEAYGVGGLGLVGKGGGGTGEGTIGLGNTGLIGKGGGGSGGAGFGGRGKRVPRVRQAKASVEGNLDSDIIRRIVRAHVNEVRYCYNQGLARDPDLEGRVVVEFTIGATGKVASASAEDSTLDDEKVTACVAKAVKRWKFPKPGDGGDVTVTYPFVLSPG